MTFIHLTNISDLKRGSIRRNKDAGTSILEERQVTSFPLSKHDQSAATEQHKLNVRGVEQCTPEIMTHPLIPRSLSPFRLYNADLLNREDEEVAFKEQLATTPPKIN